MLSEQEVGRIRSDFPVLKEVIHLASAAVGPMPARSIRAIKESLDRAYKAWDWSWARETLKQCKETISHLINSNPDEVALIRSTTEGINAIASGISWKKGENMVIDDLEYPANVIPWYHQARMHGLEVRVVKSKNGSLSLESFQEKIDERTRVVAVSHVQFVNGFRIDLKKLSKVVHEAGALLFVDAIQSLGALKVDVKELNVDAISAGGYKWLCGPIGTGLLYIRKEVIEEINPAHIGFESLDEEEERGLWLDLVTGLRYVRDYCSLSSKAKRFEYGSRNAALVAGLKSSIEYLLEIGMNRIERRVEELADYLMKRVEEEGYSTITPKEKGQRAGIVNFNPGIDLRREEAAGKLSSKLRKRGILISVRGGGIRVSCHFFNTYDDIERLLDAIKSIKEES